ncbi:MAG: VTT domain-containing protein [Casimicrobiaceae bacterium]
MDTNSTERLPNPSPAEVPGSRASFVRQGEKTAHSGDTGQRVQSGALFDPERNCKVVAHAARVAMLVDAEDYFSAFMQAAQAARESIIIIGWDFDSRTQLAWDTDAASPHTQLGDFLNALVKARRSLEVHILDWDYPLVFGTDRETRPLYGMGWKPRRRVHLSFDNTHPVGGSHHQKIVVVDDAVAFGGGLDLTCRRWDTCAHRPNDERRTAAGRPYPPFHDVMAMVDGEAARVLASIARERWQCATGKVLPAVDGEHDPWPQTVVPQLADVEVAVSRTVPKTETTEDVREIEALFVDMIAAARDYIYLENQYFTSERIGKALEARLKEPEAPEIVVVTRLLSHGWLEEHTMEVLRTRLIRDLHRADSSGRFEVYYPHIDGLAEKTCIDVHSKVTIVDDVLLRIGSANLSNRSMGFDTECDLSFAASGEVQQRAVRDFRDGLLAEHLGASIDDVRKSIKKTGSLHPAIRSLQCTERTLRVLDNIPDHPDTAIDLASMADPERPVSLDQLIDEFSPDVEEHRRKGLPWGKIAIVSVVIAALMAAWRFTPLSEFLEPKRVTAWAEHVRGTPWVALGIVLAHIPAAITLFPRPLITLFAVIVFGPILGLGYSLAGIMLAATVNFFIGRQISRDRVRRLAGERLNRMSHMLRKRGILAVVAVGIVPVAPFAVEGMVAGAIRIPYRDYFIGTFLAMLPGTIATSIFGDQLKRALSDASTINYWVIGAAVIGFGVLMFFLRRWFKQQEQADQKSDDPNPAAEPAGA